MRNLKAERLERAIRAKREHDGQLAQLKKATLATMGEREDHGYMKGNTLGEALGKALNMKRLGKDD